MDVVDCIVVGAGIQGSATAFHLAKRGHSTLLLEQFPLPHTRGSSHGASRIIRYAYEEPWFAKMMTSAYKQWRQLEEDTNSTLIMPAGLLYASGPPTDTVDNIQRALQNIQQPFQRLDAIQLQKRYPMLRNMDDHEAIYDPSAGIMLADKCLAAYRKLFLDNGGQLRDCEAVTSIEPGDIVSVITSQRCYKARSLILTAGPWTNSLMSPLGLTLPLKVVRVCVSYWKTHTDDYMRGKFPTFVMRGAVTQPNGDCLDVFGLPPLEYPGHIKICVHGGPTIDPNLRDAQTEDWDLSCLKKYVDDHFSGVESTPSINEACIYTLTPDDSFILDTHPQWKNIVIGAGFSGTGFKMAPVVGEMLADMATGKPYTFDMAPFRMSRFKSSKL